jgi:hypothetical protein
MLIEQRRQARPPRRGASGREKDCLDTATGSGATAATLSPSTGQFVRVNMPARFTIAKWQEDVLHDH